MFQLLLQFAKVTQKMSFGSVTKDNESSLSNFTDRFYRTLYELIFKVHMSKSTQLDGYFAILFKAVKADHCVPRCIAFIKRLLQMTFINEPNFTAAALLIISEIFKARPDITEKVFAFEYSG